MASREDQISRLSALFSGFAGAHGTHGTPTQDRDKGGKWGIKPTAKTLREPVTRELWKLHLEGKRPLGVIAINERDNCWWGSIDVDEYEDDARILKLVEAVERTPLVPCRSKSGGLHLFVFLEKETPAEEFVPKLREMAAGLGLAQCEIFPKQTKILAERGDLGNWMVMPYYGDTYGGKIREQVGLKKTGAEMLLTEFLSHAERKRCGLADLEPPSSLRRATAEKGKQTRRPKVPFGDGPPCLQHLAGVGALEDGRKRTLFMMALYHKKVGGDWEHAIEESNRQFMHPPLPAEELLSIVRSVKKRDYQYTCKEEPMHSHCDASACRLRKFGVGNGGNVPELKGITKLLTEPPIWFVDVEDQRLEVSTETLQNYPAFHRACMERLNKCYAPISQKEWLFHLGDAMQRVETLPAPPEVARDGHMLELLGEFLTNRERGERREDILLGRPWHDEDGGVYRFRLKDFMSFLWRENVRRLERQDVTRALERLGGRGGMQLNVRNEKNARHWMLPERVIDRAEDGLPLPAEKEEKI